MRNRNIETAKLACFLNSLKPSSIRVVRRKKIERTKEENRDGGGEEGYDFENHCPSSVSCELGAFHSITSSARASSVGGTSRPSALAVLRFTTSSYFVGACTGRSAGFSPLRMRST